MPVHTVAERIGDDPAVLLKKLRQAEARADCRHFRFCGHRRAGGRLPAAMNPTWVQLGSTFSLCSEGLTAKPLISLVGVAGLEPATPGFGVMSITVLLVSFCFASFDFVLCFVGVVRCFVFSCYDAVAGVSTCVVYFLCTCVRGCSAPFPSGPFAYAPARGLLRGPRAGASMGHARRSGNPHPPSDRDRRSPLR